MDRSAIRGAALALAAVLTACGGGATPNVAPPSAVATASVAASPAPSQPSPVTQPLPPVARQPTAASQSTAAAKPTPSAAAATAVNYVAGSSKKVCQLTGETDHETGKPTASQTASRYGLDSADLGYSFEHDGKLFFLMGDTVNTKTFNGKPNGTNDPPRDRDHNDVIGYSSDTSIDNCVKLDFYKNANGAFKNPTVLDAQGKSIISLSTDEAPLSGISVGGKMYVYFMTDNPTPDNTPEQGLGHSTRSVLGESDDDGSTFHYVYDVSKGPGAKFVMITPVAAPDGYIYLYGSEGGDQFRKSPPFLARKKASDIATQAGTEYLTGLGADGSPRFSTNEADAAPLFSDVNGNGANAKPEDCTSHKGVEFNQFVRRWVMLYDCHDETQANPAGILMRTAQQPWGPWSGPQTIFNSERDGGACHFIHKAPQPGATPCDNLSSTGITGDNRVSESGGPYAPFFISRFTTGDANKGTSTFYWTLATWNPYGQVIMASNIQLG
ncbi:MAG: DUF4185 domain-containing protein [Chloroflexi bacterium]|nr:DUF4185 domain-containing protein [Chloroflexota bacterium]